MGNATAARTVPRHGWNKEMIDDCHQKKVWWTNPEPNLSVMCAWEAKCYVVNYSTCGWCVL